MPVTAEQVSIAVKRLCPNAIIPRYQSDGASGMDLHAALDKPITIEPNQVTLVPTGIAIAVPEGYEAQVRPRSGLAAKHAISIPNAPGTIDSDYRGPVLVALINLGKDPFQVDPDMRIAQLVIGPVVRAVLHETQDLEETARGAGGFGSTGR